MTGGEIPCPKRTEEVFFGKCLLEAGERVRFVWLQGSSCCIPKQKQTAAKFKFASDVQKQAAIKSMPLTRGENKCVYGSSSL
jgi:hypothetical protein